MKIKTLLKNPKSWCKGTNARDKHRHKVNASSKTAVRFCLAGALERCYGKSNELVEVRNLLEKKLIMRGFSITEFNDLSTTTHRDILELVRRLDV